MKKIKKNDQVVVVCGKDKGKQGKVLELVGKDRLIIEGLCLVRKHTKRSARYGDEVGILEKNAAIHISNVSLYNTLTKSAGKVGFRLLADGRKQRYFKLSNEAVNT